MARFTWLVAAIMVSLIMTETDIGCGHTKTTLHARGVNTSRKIFTFSQLNSIKSALVVLIL